MEGEVGWRDQIKSLNFVVGWIPYRAQMECWMKSLYRELQQRGLMKNFNLELGWRAQLESLNEELSMTTLNESFNKEGIKEP